MDPTTALEELRQLIVATADGEIDFTPGDIEERFMALDEWLSNGGFLPEQWSKGR